MINLIGFLWVVAGAAGVSLIVRDIGVLTLNGFLAAVAVAIFFGPFLLLLASLAIFGKRVLWERKP